MPIFKYEKLVRDNIATWHVESGHIPRVKRLSGQALIDALCKKLHEETDEIISSSSKIELTEEIADVFQVLDDLRMAAGVTRDDVEKVREAKAAKKGGFRHGVYIESVNIPDENDEWAKYCRASPEKYPEIIHLEPLQKEANRE